MNKNWLILGINPHGTICIHNEYENKKLAMQAHKELIDLNKYPTMIFWVSSRQNFIKKQTGK